MKDLIVGSDLRGLIDKVKRHEAKVIKTYETARLHNECVEWVVPREFFLTLVDAVDRIRDSIRILEEHAKKTRKRKTRRQP